MRISRKLIEEIKKAVNEPFEEDRIIGVKRLLRTAYCEGIIVAKKEESSSQTVVSDVKDKIIGGLLDMCEVTIKPNSETSSDKGSK